MKGVESPLTVSLRIRPLNEDEIIHGATPVAHGVQGNVVVLLDPTEDPDDVLRVNRSREKQYVFDSVFDGMSGQEEVFAKTTKSLIDNVIHGFNATVFAYGATGAGKTHTMLGTQFEPGIMPRTLNALFQAMEDTQDSMQYKVNMSYFEIYNEMIRDLLNPSSGYLELREDGKGDITVAGLTEVSTRSTVEIMGLLQQGNAVRTQEPTKANLTSSRSHALLQVVVKQRSRARNIHEHIRSGKLYLIDLAGSERASNTQNRGKRMVEGAHINRSLLALGNCINALSEKGGKYVNYRDSKLTRLLKDSLGGNCKTVMIAHISPASLSFEESRNTLVYADRAKHIKTKVRKNLIDVQYHVAQYTAIIQELREEIERLQQKLHHKTGDGAVSSIQAVQNEVNRHEHEVELAVVKERLLTAFRDQMELRESWMELNTALMEIEGERNRNLRVVTEWEGERLKNLKRRDSTDGESTDNREKEQEKLRELQGYSEETPEPEEVREARQEMKNLVKEMQRTESIKSTVEKEIGESRQKITSLVEELPRITGNKEHLEILTLLCKVHEKEIENTELKMHLLLRQHEMENNELAIQTYTHYRNLCDEIIRQQRALIDEHKITCPKELEELYELYLHEREDRQTSRAISLPSLQNLKVSSLSSLGDRRQMFGEELDKLAVVEPVRDASVLRKQLLKKSSDAMTNQDQEKEDEQKLFSHSPKSKQMKESEYTSNLLSPPSHLLSPPQVKSKEETLYSISVRSNSTVDSPGDSSNTDPNRKIEPNVASPNVPVVEHKDIVSNTRSIAALAAVKKRHKQLDPVDRLMLFDAKLNTTYVSINSHLDQLDAPHGDNYLSTSRLAYHDKKFGSVANVKSLADDAASFRSFDKRSMVTDTGLLKSNRNKTKKSKGATRTLYRNDRSKNRVVVDNNLSYQQMSPEEFFRQLARGSVRKTDNKASSNIPLSKSVQKKRQLSRQKHTARPVISDIREFDTTPTPPSTVYQLNGGDKTKPLTVQKRYRAPDSNTSTPQMNPGLRNGRRPPPTIPASYRRGDISVTGFGLK